MDLLQLVALAVLCASPALAQTWKVEREEAVSLQYRDAKGEASLIEVHCAGADSRLIVPAPTGIRDRKPLRLEVTIGETSEVLQLPASVCGRADGACVDRPVGEVSVYLLRKPGKDLALRLAKATRLSTMGAVALTTEANSSVFSEFAELCRKQRRIPAG